MGDALELLGNTDAAAEHHRAALALAQVLWPDGDAIVDRLRLACASPPAPATSAPSGPALGTLNDGGHAFRDVRGEESLPETAPWRAPRASWAEAPSARQAADSVGQPVPGGGAALASSAGSWIPAVHPPASSGDAFSAGSWVPAVPPPAAAALESTPGPLPTGEESVTQPDPSTP